MQRVWKSHVLLLLSDTAYILLQVEAMTESETQRRSGASQHMTKTSIILICVYILF